MARRSGTRTGFIQSLSPRLPEEGVFRHLREHRLIRVSQAVMDKADVRATAVIALNLLRLFTACRTLPEDLEIHIVFTEVPDRLPQLTGTDPAVKIDHGRRFPRSTRHRPRSSIVKVLELRPVVERQGADVR